MTISTAWERTTPPPPVRAVHLGLGAFHRAHQVWATQRANDAATAAGARPDELWGYASFTGRSPRSADALRTQDGRYTLLVRSADGDHPEVVDALVEVHDGADGDAWRRLFATPAVALVTLTVTEAGYVRTADGRLDRDHPDLVADVALLTASSVTPSGAAATTAPGRLVDGLRARAAAAAGPIAVIPCDNLPDNGAVVRRVVLDLARSVDPELASWIETHVSFVSTMVDRITPATTPDDVAQVAALTGRADASPVVTEPFAEWVLAGDFPAGRPRWEEAGARFVADIAVHEQRKLWLLNPGHSLLAYRGIELGLSTIAEAFADPTCRALLERLWDEARPVLPLPAAEVDAALAALRARFANARIEHRLAQIAKDGAAKLPVRVVAPAGARLASGLPVGVAQARTIAAWIRHLETTDADLATTDAGARELAARLHDLPAGPDAAAARADLALDLLDPDATATPLREAVARALTDPSATP